MLSSSVNLTQQQEGHFFSNISQTLLLLCSKPSHGSPSHSEQKPQSFPWPTEQVRAATQHSPLSDLTWLRSSSPHPELCFLLFCTHTSGTPTLGPLSVLFPLLRNSYPGRPMEPSSLTSFRSLFKCHFLTEAFIVGLKSQPSVFSLHFLAEVQCIFAY